MNINAQIGNDTIVNVPERFGLQREYEAWERMFEICTKQEMAVRNNYLKKKYILEVYKLIRKRLFK